MTPNAGQLTASECVIQISQFSTNIRTDSCSSCNVEISNAYSIFVYDDKYLQMVLLLLAATRRECGNRIEASKLSVFFYFRIRMSRSQRLDHNLNGLCFISFFWLRTLEQSVEHHQGRTCNRCILHSPASLYALGMR